ncbi:hypothetical protein G9A89_000196 [Geosiphon pyriformis]|nr:hypothetical protein G9A89_000196 [Geosiphon pyriformis]
MAEMYNVFIAADDGYEVLFGPTDEIKPLLDSVNKAAGKVQFDDLAADVNRILDKANVMFTEKIEKSECRVVRAGSCLFGPARYLVHAGLAAGEFVSQSTTWPGRRTILFTVVPQKFQKTFYQRRYMSLKSPLGLFNRVTSEEMKDRISICFTTAASSESTAASSESTAVDEKANSGQSENKHMQTKSQKGSLPTRNDNEETDTDSENEPLVRGSSKKPRHETATSRNQRKQPPNTILDVRDHSEMEDGANLSYPQMILADGRVIAECGLMQLVVPAGYIMLWVILALGVWKNNEDVRPFVVIWNGCVGAAEVQVMQLIGTFTFDTRKFPHQMPAGYVGKARAMVKSITKRPDVRRLRYPGSDDAARPQSVVTVDPTKKKSFEVRNAWDVYQEDRKKKGKEGIKTQKSTKQSRSPTPKRDKAAVKRVCVSPSPTVVSKTQKSKKTEDKKIEEKPETVKEKTGETKVTKRQRSVSPPHSGEVARLDTHRHYTRSNPVADSVVLPDQPHSPPTQRPNLAGSFATRSDIRDLRTRLNNVSDTAATKASVKADIDRVEAKLDELHAKIDSLTNNCRKMMERINSIPAAVTPRTVFAPQLPNFLEWT